MKFLLLKKTISFLLVIAITSPLLGGPVNHENITIDKYTIDYFCKLTPYGNGTMDINHPHRDSYKIKISSKYNMFKMYNRKPHYQNTVSDIIINTELYKIKPYSSHFTSKADVEFSLTYSDFEKISKTSEFEVIYPNIKFDDEWMSKISNRGVVKQSYQFLETPNNVVISSVLSTKGFKSLLEKCQDEYNTSKREKELQDIEDNKPINRLKSFFN